MCNATVNWSHHHLPLDIISILSLHYFKLNHVSTEFSNVWLQVMQEGYFWWCLLSSCCHLYDIITQVVTISSNEFIKLMHMVGINYIYYRFTSTTDSYNFIFVVVYSRHKTFAKFLSGQNVIAIAIAICPAHNHVRKYEETNSSYRSKNNSYSYTY